MLDSSISKVIAQHWRAVLLASASVMLSACVSKDVNSSSSVAASSVPAVASSSQALSSQTPASSSVAPISSSIAAVSSSSVKSSSLAPSSSSVAVSSSSEACVVPEPDLAQFNRGKTAFEASQCRACHGDVQNNGKTSGGAIGPINVAQVASISAIVSNAMSQYLSQDCKNSNSSTMACANDIEHYLLRATGVVADPIPSCDASSSSVASSTGGQAGSSLLNSSGTFTSGKENFSGVFDASANATASFSGEANFTINSTTTQPWHIQLTHAMSVVAGEQYTICFDAKAANNRSITVGVDDAGPTYASVAGGDEDISLTASYQSFSKTFFADATDSTSRLVFNLGLNAANVQLDNVGVYAGDSCGGSGNTTSSSSTAPVTSSSAGQSSSAAPAGSLGEYFAAHECGVGFTALGNGSYKACYRLENGQAECVSPGGTTPTTVAWQGGGAVNDILHVSGTGENEVSLVTTSGAVYTGGVTSVSTTPVIESNAIAVTGGRNTKCALVSEAGGKDVMCFSGGRASRPALPSGFDAVQVSSGYGVACAVNTDGEVWCWDEGGNVPPFVNKTPSKVDFAEPMVFVSAIQDAVCGIKWSGGLDCRANWYANPFLPTDDNGMGGISLRAGAFSDAMAIQSAYAQGVVITSDGKAIYLPKVGGVGVANLGVEFNNGSRFIAAGGDRGLKCALTGGGDVYCLDGSNNAVKVNSMKAEAGVCPY